MVLEKGRLIEYAPPLELLYDPSSQFYALCKKTGSLEELMATAVEEQTARRGGEGEGGQECP